MASPHYSLYWGPAMGRTYGEANETAFDRL